MEHNDVVDWCNLIQDKYTRPRVVLCLWLACHRRLATKARLKKFEILHYDKCCLYCDEDETIDHLMLSCRITKVIWSEVVRWMEIAHNSLQWKEEVLWIMSQTRGKCFKTGILKIAIAETVYWVWTYRNATIFETKVDDTRIARNIILYRGWMQANYRRNLAMLMM